MNTTYENKNNAEQTFTDRCLQSSKVLLAEIGQAKNMIVSDFHETLDTHGNLFRLALNEAEALAWQTNYPHLFYPTLATERIQAVVAWRKRQQSLHRQNSVLPKPPNWRQINPNN